MSEYWVKKEYLTSTHANLWNIRGIAKLGNQKDVIGANVGDIQILENISNLN